MRRSRVDGWVVEGPKAAAPGIRKQFAPVPLRAFAPALTGQSAGLIDAMKPAPQIIEEAVAEFLAITGRRGGFAASRSFG
jgi:hypothetical protein